jgi:YD repeat-containing protein
LYLPAQQRRFTAVDGVTDFQPAASGTGALTSDSRYVPVANFLAYDYSGALLSADDNNRHVQSVVTDQYFGLPVAQLSNVKAGEFAYNDFDSKTTVAGFTVPAGSVSSGGRTGQNAAWLNAGVAVSVPLSKNAVAKNYIFSCWIVPSGAGNATLNLTSGSTTQSYNLPIAAAGSWKYYELKIPVTAVSGSMTLSFQSNVNIGIDDILVYPDVATVSTVAYDPVWQTKTAETNGNGVSTYYSYDGMGRLQYVYDQDKNIVMKKAYVQLADETNFVMPSFDLSPVFSLYLNDHYPGHVISFTNTSTPNACLVNNNISYSWDFGDGSAAAAGTNASHAYAATGTYTVTLTATSASYGQRTTTQQVRIGTPPALIPVNFLNDFDNSTVSMTATFSQPGYSVTFSSSDLTSGTAKIIPDRYNVSVHLTGPQGTVDSFRYTGESGAKCFPNTSGAASSTFGLTDDLTFKSLVTLQITAGGCNVH